MIKQFYLIHRWDHNRSLGVRVDLEVMALKEYFTFSKAPGLEPPPSDGFIS